MPLWKIAWRSIQRRSLASILTMLSMGLGVMLVVAVLLIVGVVDESFQSNSSLGYDSIVGAKGGKLQLTLNTVYYLSQPVENLPYAFYQEFLPAEARERTENDAVASIDYENKIELLRGEAWNVVDNVISLPAGQSSLRLRVPLVPVDPVDIDKKFKFHVEVTSVGNTNNKYASAIATIVENPPNASANDDDTMVLNRRETSSAAAKKATISVRADAAVQGDPFATFQVFLSQPIDSDVTFTAALVDGVDGEYVEYLAEGKISAIPVCLGDYFGQFRVIGTTADFFNLVYDHKNKRSYEFAAGSNFTGSGEHGVFEAILGAKVAREQGLQVGDLIQPAHGAPEGKTHDEFEVVGILASSGTPQDRGVFVNMEGFNRIADHIREDGLKEVTSLLVDTRDPFRSMQLEDKLFNGPVGQVVKPVAIIFGLFSRIVGPIRNLLLVITGLICLVSGISILVSIYNSMSDRKQEIAIMRSLGAGRATVMTVVLLESVMISLIGGLIGWVTGHALIGLASGKIEAETGVVVSALDLAPPMEELSYLLGPNLTPNISVEIWLIPSLIVLAILVGFLPALSAYRTDVAEALQSSP